MSLPRLLILTAALAGTSPADAVNRVWPGPAPCNTTLQACINASSAGDRVEVASNAVIDESLIFGVPIFLQAAAGYRPILAADRVISANINVAGSWHVSLEGFTLQRGFVQGVLSGGNGTITIRRMRVLETLATGSAQISVWRNTGATGTLTYDIAENRVHHTWNTSDGAIRAAIQVLERTGGGATGRIRNNHVQASGTWATGILVDSNNTGHSTVVHNNVVLGGRSYGSINLRQGHLVSPGSGMLQAIVVSNLIQPGPPGAEQPRGLIAEAYDGALELHAVNNTVVGASYGIDVYIATAAAVSGRIANNLLAGNGNQLSIFNSGAGAIGNDHNLLHGYFSPSVTPGTGTVLADPQVRGMYGNPRLRTGSPAIGAADDAAWTGLASTWNLPSLDADGLRRLKGAGIDIGALEWGDRDLAHVARTDNIAGHTSAVDSPLSNGQPAALLFATANYHLGLVSTGHPVGMYYASSRWRLYYENTATAMASGQGWNLFVPGAGAGSFPYQTSAGNVSGFAARIDNAATDNRGDRIVLATRNWSAGAAIYNPHPIGVFHFGLGGATYWYIANIDQVSGGDMPVGIGFNVYAQDPSPNAFRVFSTPGNTSAASLMLDHALLNDRPCARLHVSRVHDGTPVSGGFDVWYSSGRWRIFGYAGMPSGATFHVVVDPGQVFECSDVIFADGFDS